MNSDIFQGALTKGASGERMNRAEALALGEARTPEAVHQLGRAGLANRLARFGERATYVFNLQINPSNICVGSCRFCHFSVRPKDQNAYVLDDDEILGKVRDLEPSEVHIVGGLNRQWDYERNLSLIRRLRSDHPDLHVKAFTATEIDWFAKTARLEVSEVLTSLRDAGLNALPGGGAEILSDRIWDIHCPNKLRPEGWIDIHKAAHRLGIRSNATMLTGLGETLEERVDHLLRLREVQDETGGFECFVPLAFLPGSDRRPEDFPSPLEQLAVIALARLVLDNFPHVKAYWPMIGLETAAAGLSWGADDLDGTLGEERIAHAAGARTPRALVREYMEQTIRLGGFTPVERNGRFQAEIQAEAVGQT